MTRMTPAGTPTGDTRSGGTTRDGTAAVGTVRAGQACDAGTSRTGGAGRAGGGPLPGPAGGPGYGTAPASVAPAQRVSGPSSRRATTIRWIWLVPSTIWSALASRISRSTGKSAV